MAECQTLCADEPKESCVEAKAKRTQAHESFVACRQSDGAAEVKPSQPDPKQIGVLMEAHAMSLPDACRQLMRGVRDSSETLQACHEARGGSCHALEVALDGQWFELHGCVQAGCREQGSSLKEEICLPYEARALTHCGPLFTELHAAQGAFKVCAQDQLHQGDGCRQVREQSHAAGLAYAQCKRERCLLYPEELSRVVCAPVPSLVSPADCHAELAVRDAAQQAFVACRRESSQASASSCWKEVRACKNHLHSEYRATLASVGQLQSIVDGAAYLLYWVLALVGIFWSVAKRASSTRRTMLLRAGVLVLSLSLLSWLCFGVLFELLFPGGMIAH